MKRQIKAFMFCALIATATASSANLASKLRSLVGWTIIHSGSVTGYIDKDGKKKDSYEGCEYGRKLIIDYQYVVTCQTYTYSYAYNPDAVLFAKSGSFKLLVESEVLDVTK